MREAVVAAARGLRARGLSAGMSGNVSARVRDGFLVTPSGVAYETLGPGQIVHVDASGAASGFFAPSSEWRLHRAIYRARPEVNAIVHAHPRFSTALACARREIPPFHYMVTIAGGSTIRCAPYATFGTEEIAQLAVAALADRRACLLANHGSVALGDSAGAALDLVEEVEALAAQYVTALQAGPVVLLNEEEIAAAVERFRDYGQEGRRTRTISR